MDGAIDMYYFPASPPCTAVLLLARALGVVLNLKIVDIMAGEQMQPDYIKMNPMHSVPTMNDNGFVIWESRAIMLYLVDKYDKEGKFAVTDPKEKGLVNNMLFFDVSVLYQRIVTYFFPVVLGKETPNAEKSAKIQDALQALNTMLEGKECAIGNKMTVADFSLMSSITNAEAIGFDISKYEHVKAWYERTKGALASVGYAEIMQAGAKQIGHIFQNPING